MRVFKIKRFAKWARKEIISDSLLRTAVKEMDEGLIEASLGGNGYKKRIRLGGRGKRGGARTLLAYRTNDLSFFIFGFAKAKKSSIKTEELVALKELANNLLGYKNEKLNQLLCAGYLEEIKDG